MNSAECSGPVLVVDDDEDIRESLVEVLEDIGYRVLSARHGGEALDLLQGGAARPCLILLDLMMPIMDGPAFRNRQLEHPELSTIPVVIISAYPNADERAEELRATGTLRKPIQYDTLVGTVGKYCRAARPPVAS